MESTDLKLFLQAWEGKKPSLDMPKAYLPLALNLMRGEEELVRRVIKLLTDNITAWAKKYSPVYKNCNCIMNKERLGDKSKWYVDMPEVEFASMATNGSTTGIPFHYRRWQPALRPIEITNHYKMVLQEFGLEHKPKVLYMLANIKKGGKVIEVFPGSSNFTEQHGADEAEVHFVEKTALHKYDQNAYYDIILNHLCNNPVDVILASGVEINSLVWHLKRTGIRKHFAKLLSNTQDMLVFDDVDWLQDNGIVTHVCDHMRCWDGGASFFTCTFGRYHLMDNLAYCFSDNINLISTDYFSFPSPFVNYWNGDYAIVEPDYKRCECGRLYRPFQFLKNRPFSLKGTAITKWEREIVEAGIKGVKQIKCDIDTIEIITDKELSICEEEKLRNIIGSFMIVFKTMS